MTVALRTPQIKRSPRLHGRRTFAGSIVGAVLTVERGSHSVAVDKEGNETSRTFEAQRIAPIEIGDLLVLEQRNPSLFAIAEVGSIVDSGWSRQKYVIRLALGVVDGEVWVLPSKLARGR